MKDDNDSDSDISDLHVYSWVEYYSSTVKFFVKALMHYERHLSQEAAALREDTVLSGLLDDDFFETSKMGRELERTRRIKGYLDEQLRKCDGVTVDVGSITHGTARFLKSVALVYLRHLYDRRSQFSARHDISGATLQALDGKISEIEGTLNSGILADCKAIPLLFDDLVSVKFSEDESIKVSGDLERNRVRPIVVSSIEVVDSELRRRCLDLLAKFQEDGDQDRLDSVIREATVILENRLRAVLRDSTGEDSNKLIEKAFGKNSGLISVSTVPAEQAGVHALFRGVFGHIRNRHHHKIGTGLQANRVLQILGLVDYLLSLLDGHEINDEV